MTQPAKANEPTMEEILASIRRIIADDDPTKTPKAADSLPPTPVAPRPAPAPAVPPPPASDAGTRQVDIDAMLSQLNAAPPRPPMHVPPPPPPSPPPVPDVLELTEAMATEPSAEAEPANDGFRTIDGRADVVFDDDLQEPELPSVPAPPATRYDPAPSDALLSASTSAAVDSAFNTLAQTVLVQNGRTLEDLVREMLRPLLKNWLDDNLPGLVERLVRAEIERVSRGRTS